MQRKATLSAPIRKPHSEGTWAVSYADFLMVLLSFFIIFFSIDKKNALKQVVLSMQSVAAPASAPAAVTGTAHANTLDARTPDESPLINELSALLPTAHLQVKKTAKKVEVLLPDNIYRPGEFAAPSKALDRVIAPLLPYANKIEITLIGHADEAVFHTSVPVIQKDNFTLASVRAAYASIYFQNKMPETKIWMQATASHSGKLSRSTRSLTLLIQERQDAL